MLVLDSNTWNHLTVGSQMNFGSLKNGYLRAVRLQIIYFIYMYKKDLALSNLQELMCRKTQPTFSETFSEYNKDGVMLKNRYCWVK